MVGNASYGRLPNPQSPIPKAQSPKPIQVRVIPELNYEKPQIILKIVTDSYNEKIAIKCQTQNPVPLKGPRTSQ